MCGASLIRADVALTAAHCLPSSIDAAAVDEMRIYAGGWVDRRTGWVGERMGSLK
jgi:V8-like Glu-specific endopeptidase